jgi:hypothetical protein
MPPRSGLLGAIIAVCLLLALPDGADGAFGHAPVAEFFDKDFSKFFIPSTKKSYSLRKSKKTEKPLMVIMTRAGCGACQNLKQSVNLAQGEETIKSIAGGRVAAAVPRLRAAGAVLRSRRDAAAAHPRHRGGAAVLLPRPRHHTLGDEEDARGGGVRGAVQPRDWRAGRGGGLHRHSH